ncbi:unnamed protein product [Protopolystoma xenopodis]|uniref:mannosyl-oligosaccharide glucosidase n=1 Tax=Protopolystoma xenopodis TaxID=117903 RepID=A0A448X517_9PLAT|nr:unnamed protein product [Protopolystoma xenopodis]
MRLLMCGLKGNHWPLAYAITSGCMKKRNEVQKSVYFVVIRTIRIYHITELARVALANLLGGIGFFYGSSLVQSPESGPTPIEYWPAPLFTATPSRPQFPRGFLWDEGFHGLVLVRWNIYLALETFGHWLDLMNIEGWIPREQILGWEARARVPERFIVQSNSVANPPALVLAIEVIQLYLPNFHSFVLQIPIKHYFFYCFTP